MGFDNTELLDLIERRFRSHREFGAAMGWSDSKTSYKLKDYSTWSHADVEEAMSVLGIPASHIKKYFFTPKVQES